MTLTALKFAQRSFHFKFTHATLVKKKSNFMDALNASRSDLYWELDPDQKFQNFKRGGGGGGGPPPPPPKRQF